MNRSTLIVSLYGFIAAITYENVAKSINALPIVGMPILTLLGLTLVAPFSKKKGVLEEFQGMALLRPLLFSISQLLVVTALSFGTTFSMFASTAAGTMFAILLGKIFLKEKIGWFGISGILITFSGVFMMTKNHQIPSLALLAGLIQGSTVFFARKRSINGANATDMATASLLLLFILSVPISLITWNITTINPIFNIKSMLAAGLGFAFLQSSYCYLSGKMEAWMLSLVGNTRIPASVLIGAVFASQDFSWMNFWIGIWIFFGISLAYWGMKKPLEINHD